MMRDSGAVDHSGEIVGGVEDGNSEIVGTLDMLQAQAEIRSDLFGDNLNV
jgi:hypothetical protein